MAAILHAHRRFNYIWEVEQPPWIFRSI